MAAPAHPAHAERVRQVVEPAVESVGLVLEDVARASRGGPVPWSRSSST